MCKKTQNTHARFQLDIPVNKTLKLTNANETYTNLYDKHFIEMCKKTHKTHIMKRIRTLSGPRYGLQSLKRLSARGPFSHLNSPHHVYFISVDISVVMIHYKHTHVCLYDSSAI
jgi:hypothetical protein